MFFIAWFFVFQEFSVGSAAQHVVDETEQDKASGDGQVGKVTFPGDPIESQVKMLVEEELVVDEGVHGQGKRAFEVLNQNSKTFFE